jgi:hypothetical protein
MDITTVISAAVGAGAGFALSYILLVRRIQPKKAVIIKDEKGIERKKYVSVEELERRKREMRTLMVERDMLSSALMRIYEAENEGRITKEERELISRRYSMQIKQIESKLKDAELYVEVGELERLRDELVSLFQSKIRNIETRLEEARQRLGLTLSGQEIISSKEIAQPTDELEAVVQRKAKQEIPEPERRVNELRQEIMQALSKLEQIDTEKKVERRIQRSSFKTCIRDLKRVKQSRDSWAWKWFNSCICTEADEF